MRRGCPENGAQRKIRLTTGRNIVVRESCVFTHGKNSHEGVGCVKTSLCSFVRPPGFCCYVVLFLWSVLMSFPDFCWLWLFIFLAPFSVVHFVPRKRFRRYRVCMLMRFVPRKRFMRYEKQFCEKKVRNPASLGASWTFWRLMMISQPEMLTWLPCEFSPSRHDSAT